MSKPIDLSKIREKISEIEEKSATGDYIYRGELECYPKVSSTLYREHKEDIEAKNFDIEVAQREMLNVVKRHTGDTRTEFVERLAIVMGQRPSQTAEFELLTELQHYGGKTNLIDFTTDYFIALFFACDGYHDKIGRVILQKTEEIKKFITYPQNPRHRVIAQKSVFVHPPMGFIEPKGGDIVPIPANLKRPLLQHLRKYHSVFTETIYNDIHGFIRTQSIHRTAYTAFFRGFTHQNKGRNATTSEEKQTEYKKSIVHYDTAIELNAEHAQTHCNRGEALLHLKEWNKARVDLIAAEEMGVNIINSFHNDYASIEEFEQENGFKLPADIAAMLTPP